MRLATLDWVVREDTSSNSSGSGGCRPQDVANLEYRPTTLHYSSYLRKMAYEGRFIDLITTWLAVEWPYLEWAQRLVAAGKRPGNYYYQVWIDNHTNQHMIDFVSWLRHTVDTTPISPDDRVRLQRNFRDVLRYEFLFWEMAYRDEKWPGGMTAHGEGDLVVADPGLQQQCSAFEVTR